jgi:hypothetical protein
LTEPALSGTHNRGGQIFALAVDLGASVGNELLRSLLRCRYTGLGAPVGTHRLIKVIHVAYVLIVGFGHM